MCKRQYVYRMLLKIQIRRKVETSRWNHVTHSLIISPKLECDYSNGYYCISTSPLICIWIATVWEHEIGWELNYSEPSDWNGLSARGHECANITHFVSYIRHFYTVSLCKVRCREHMCIMHEKGRERGEEREKEKIVSIDSTSDSKQNMKELIQPWHFNWNDYRNQ